MLWVVVGAVSPHFDDVLVSGEPGILLRAREYLGRCVGVLEARQPLFVNDGIEVSRAKCLLVQLAQKNFTDALKPKPTFPELRALRQRPLSIEKA